MDYKKLATAILVVNLVALDGAVGYVVYKSQTSINNIQATPVAQTEYVDKCGEECLREITNQISSLTGSKEKVEPSPSPSPKSIPVKVTTKTKARREEIMTIPGSGSTSANDWADITGTHFYFDTRDWPGLVEVYFEANMKLFNGNGVAYVRLFDETHGIGVTGSDNDTTSQADGWAKSQKINFWAGRNLIKVQGKSLTADTMVYNQGRLRIIMEN